MQPGEDPRTYLSRVDDIVGMLELLGEHENEDEVNRKIIRHLCGDFDIEKRFLFFRMT